MKILILKPSSLGDVVQALPVLRMIRLAHPSAQVHWWIASELEALLKGDPDLAGLFLFDRREATNPISWPDLVSQVRSMREHQFDYVIDLQGLARSGILAWLSNGVETIGLRDPREGAPAFYDISVPRPSYHTHAVDWYLEVLKVLGIPIRWDFEWLPERSEVKELANTRFGVPNARITFIPGARWPTKLWPVGYFSETARIIARRYPGHTVTILGSKADSFSAAQIKTAAPDIVQDLTGRTTLPETVELLRESKVVVTNDTGPMHIAAALGVPIIPLFGPTAPTRTGPYGQIDHALRHLLPCVPCMKSECHYQVHMACLRGITPDHVLASLAARMEERKNPNLTNSR